MERQTGAAAASFLYGDAGYTRVALEAPSKNLYNMNPGDNVLHLVVKTEAIVYLPPLVKATDGYYLITSTGESTEPVSITTIELEKTIVTLAPCSTVMLVSNGINWYEIALISKS